MKRDKGTPQLRAADQLNVLLIQIYPHSVASDDITSLEMPREIPMTDIKSSVTEVLVLIFSSNRILKSFRQCTECAVLYYNCIRSHAAESDVYLGESPKTFSVIGNCRVSCEMSMSVYVQENLFCPYGMGLGPVRQLTTTWRQ
jgi:hypothetical protein